MMPQAGSSHHKQEMPLVKLSDSHVKPASVAAGSSSTEPCETSTVPPAPDKGRNLGTEDSGHSTSSYGIPSTYSKCSRTVCLRPAPQQRTHHSLQPPQSLQFPVFLLLSGTMRFFFIIISNVFHKLDLKRENSPTIFSV